MKHTHMRISVVAAFALILGFALGAGSVLYAVDPINDPNFTRGVRRYGHENQRNDILRRRTEIEEQPDTNDRQDIEQQRKLSVQRAGERETDAPEALEHDMTVEELIQRCFDFGFTRSRLTSCIGNANNGVLYQP